MIKQDKLSTSKYKDFSDCLKAFLKDTKKEEYPKFVSVGIAGPRKGDIVKITNAPWPEFDIKVVKSELGFTDLFILNDFEANGYGVLTMPKEFYTQLTPENKIMPGAPKVLLGTGTGLGECIVTKGPGETDYVVYPGEGGHVDFAPRNELEFGFMMYVKEKQHVERVSYERCCCGLAIPLMFDYLKGLSKKAGEADTALHTKLAPLLKNLLHLLDKEPNSDKINPMVVEIDTQVFEAGMKKTDKVCEKTVELFASLYGAETGNLALKILPYGGIYLLSSVTLAMKDHIMNEKTFKVFFLIKIIKIGKFHGKRKNEDFTRENAYFHC